jgi:hypothetical protein
MFTLEELLDRLDTARERTLMALEMLPDEALVQPGAIGRWSIADLLSILTAWDAEVVTGLMQLQGGKTPERLLAALRQPDIYNAQRHQDAQGRDLDVIFDDFQSSRLHLEEWLSGLSERALSDPRHYKALGGEPLARLIVRTTADHEARYLPFLTGFAQRWEATQEEATDEIDETSSEGLGEVIPLGQIDILSLPAANGDSAALVFPEDDDDDFE